MDAEDETIALIARLRADAKVTHAQAEMYERDGKALIERAARKRTQAFVWERAAARLEQMNACGELRAPDAGPEEEESEDVRTSP